MGTSVPEPLERVRFFMSDEEGSSKLSVGEGLLARVCGGRVARLAATNLAVQGTAFVAGVVAARSLGVSGRGDLAAVVLWPLLAANVATLGIDWALAVQAGRDPGARVGLVRLSLLHAVLAGPAFMLIGWALVRWALPTGRDDLAGLSAGFLWIIPLYLLWMNFLAVDNGMERYARYNLTKLSFYVLYTSGYLACWALGAAQIRYFLGAQLAAMLLTVGVRVMRSIKAALREQLERGTVRRTISLARGFALSTAASMTVARIDVILVMFLFGSRELGLYVVAQAVANIPSLLSQAFGVRTFGGSAKVTDDGDFGRLVISRFRQSLVLSGAAALVMWAGATWIISLLFGASFEAAGSVARVLFVSSWLFNSGRIIDEGFRGQGRPAFGTVGFAIYITCVCVAGPVLAGPMGLGVMGVAWSALGGSALLLGFLMVAFRGRRSSVGAGRQGLAKNESTNR